MARDDLGRTPLHILASYNPQHWRAIRWLATWCPASARVGDVEGGLPLHSLCRCYAPEKADGCDASLLELITACRESALARDAKGRTPLHLLCRLEAPILPTTEP